MCRQGVNAVMPGGAEAGEDVFEPGFEVELVVIARGHEAGNDGGFLASALVADEEPVFCVRVPRGGWRSRLDCCRCAIFC